VLRAKIRYFTKTEHEFKDIYVELWETLINECYATFSGPALIYLTNNIR
jgi:hypothetical protein